MQGDCRSGGGRVFRTSLFNEIALLFERVAAGIHFTPALAICRRASRPGPRRHFVNSRMKASTRRSTKFCGSPRVS
jgi:hypothetical protein